MTLLGAVIGIIAVWFVSCGEYKGDANSDLSNAPILSKSLLQMNADTLVKMGLTGKGVKIGIIDVGFMDADRKIFLKHLFDNNRVVAQKDFVTPNNATVYRNSTNTDWHGTTTLKFTTGRNKNIVYGLASEASFYLARADHGNKESRNEERNVIAALDWLHQQGVRLVNLSIGYSYGFDNPEENYLPSDIDGASTLISKEVKKYIHDYDMILVTSAGNEGQSPWKILTAPADVEGILTVGLSDLNKLKDPNSSEGSSISPYFKPNISCHNQEAIPSFSPPIIAGIIACLLERSPELTARQIINYLQMSSHLYPYCNSYIGCGIPNIKKLLPIMRDSIAIEPELMVAKGNSVNIETTSPFATVFYKEDEWYVLGQAQLIIKDNILIVQRPDKLMKSKLVVDNKIAVEFHVEEWEETVVRTTVALEDKVIEIVWEK